MMMSLANVIWISFDKNKLINFESKNLFMITNFFITAVLDLYIVMSYVCIWISSYVNHHRIKRKTQSISYIFIKYLNFLMMHLHLSFWIKRAHWTTSREGQKFTWSIIFIVDIYYTIFASLRTIISIIVLVFFYQYYYCCYIVHLKMRNILKRNK